MHGLVNRSGIGAATANQIRALTSYGVEVTTDPRTDYDVLHLQWIGPRSFYYATRARREGRPVVASVHSLPSLLRGAFSLSGIVVPSYRAYLRRFLRCANLIITPSASAVEELIPLVDGRPVRPVSSGVDLTKFTYDQEKRRLFRTRYKLDRPTVLAVGQVIPLKGVEDFIAVARLLPQFQFIWVGPRPSRWLYFNPRFELAIRHHPDNVRFLGYLPTVEEAYNGSDVYFHPSYGESLGLAVIEAAAVGLPLVVRDLAVYRSWLRTDPAGRWGTTPAEFAHAVMDLIAANRPVARHAFVEEHSLPHVGERLIEAYTEVLS